MAARDEVPAHTHTPTSDDAGADAEPIPTDAEVRRAIVDMAKRDKARADARFWGIFIAIMCAAGFLVIWILTHSHGAGWN